MITTKFSEKPLNLNKVKKGEKRTIVGLHTNNKDTLKKMMSMGILPGLDLKVIQTYPTFIINIGYTCIALDNETASVILTVNAS